MLLKYDISYPHIYLLRHDNPQDMIKYHSSLNIKIRVDRLYMFHSMNFLERKSFYNEPLRETVLYNYRVIHQEI